MMSELILRDREGEIKARLEGGFLKVLTGSDKIELIDGLLNPVSITIETPDNRPRIGWRVLPVPPSEFCTVHFSWLYGKSPKFIAYLKDASFFSAKMRAVKGTKKSPSIKRGVVDLWNND